MLRATELETYVSKAEIGFALCDARLMEEMELMKGIVSLYVGFVFNNELDQFSFEIDCCSLGQIGCLC